MNPESPLQRGIRVLALGAAPATLAAVMVLVVGQGDPKTPLVVLWIVLAFAGTAGLWCAVFTNPRSISWLSSMVAAALVAGLAASWPVFAVLGHIVLDPPKITLKGFFSTNTWLPIWLFFGPIACALIYCIQHVVAIHRRGRST